jgi:hypothetical protein
MSLEERLDREAFRADSARSEIAALRAHYGEESMTRSAFPTLSANPVESEDRDLTEAKIRTALGKMEGSREPFVVGVPPRVYDRLERERGPWTRHAFVVHAVFPDEAHKAGLCQEYVQHGPTVGLCGRQETDPVHIPPVSGTRRRDRRA